MDKDKDVGRRSLRWKCKLRALWTAVPQAAMRPHPKPAQHLMVPTLSKMFSHCHLKMVCRALQYTGTPSARTYWKTSTVRTGAVLFLTSLTARLRLLHLANAIAVDSGV
jgi:hypothetical protein